MDRMFYAGGELRMKPPPAVAGAPGRGHQAADQINKYFQINCQPIVSSSYWGIAYGRNPGEAQGDGEGLHTMRVLGRNMAWMLKCIEAGRAAGINPPELEPKVMTNVVREDLLEG
ncbi:MAG: flavodoxin family protein [Adlercreutzia sp.]